MKKLLFALASSLAFLPLILTADVGETPSSTFTGTITAIETGRDSITVENRDKQVKMFAVSASRKESLQTGQTVTVGYIEGDQWPLKTTSLSSN